jgi:tetratricopeptide repeat protein 30
MFVHSEAFVEPDCSNLAQSSDVSCLQALPGSRAALSLLGHCYYHQGHYQSACDTYALLTRFVPELPEYRLYHAQALYKAGELEEALRIADSMTALQDQVEQLKVAIRYAADQLQDCRQMLRARVSQGPDMAQNEGCILYREGKHRCLFLALGMTCLHHGLKCTMA